MQCAVLPIVTFLTRGPKASHFFPQEQCYNRWLISKKNEKWIRKKFSCPRGNTAKTLQIMQHRHITTHTRREAYPLNSNGWINHFSSIHHLLLSLKWFQGIDTVWKTEDKRVCIWTTSSRVCASEQTLVRPQLRNTNFRKAKTHCTPKIQRATLFMLNKNTSYQIKQPTTDIFLNDKYIYYLTFPTSCGCMANFKDSI
jgi:hypothetical protein